MGRLPFLLLWLVGAIYTLSGGESSAVQSDDDTNDDDLRLRPAAVERAADKGFLTFGFENDVFFRTDRHYTSGLRGAYVTPEGKALWGLGHLAKRLPFVSPGDRIRSQHSLQQYMYTADDITDPNPPLGERPYAGLLSLDTTILAQADDHLDMLGLSIGITGGPSLAQGSQILLHSFLPESPRPEGWETQVDFEVTAQIRYDRIYFIGDYDDADRQYDFQPRFGVDIGTAHINAYAGGQFRWGTRLYREAGPALNRPGKPGVDWFALPGAGEQDIYTFIGADVRAVAHNFSLEGGLRPFERSVARENLVGEFNTGVVITNAYGRFSFTAVYRSREYETQAQPDWYAGLFYGFPF